MRTRLLAMAMAMVILMGLCIGGANVIATNGTAGNDAIGNYGGDSGAKYIAIATTLNSLTLLPGGLLRCVGETTVWNGYSAGIKIELQQQSGSTWSTFKSWETTGARTAYMLQDWYVAHGTYRLKLTHTALNSNGSVAETVIIYSKVVIY